MKRIILVVLGVMFLASAAYATIPTPTYWYKSDATNITSARWINTYSGTSTWFMYTPTTLTKANWTESTTTPRNLENSIKLVTNAGRTANDTAKLPPQMGEDDNDWGMSFWANVTSGQSYENSMDLFGLAAACDNTPSVELKIRESATNQIRFYAPGAGTPSISYALDVFDNVARHYTITYNESANTFRLFINGVKVGTSNAGTGAMPEAANSAYLGASWLDNAACTGPLYGEIDAYFTDVRIWNNTLLTYGQVDEVYKSNTSGAPPTSAYLDKIRIYHPTPKQGILNYSHYVKFKVVGNKSSYKINVSNNGVYVKWVNATNNTNKIVWLNLTETIHNISLRHRTIASVKNSTTFNVTYVTWGTAEGPGGSATVYELMKYQANMSAINVPAEMSKTKVWFSFNNSVGRGKANSNYTATYTGGKYRVNPWTPIISAETKSTQSYWYVNISLPGGTVQTNRSAALANTIYWLYEINYARNNPAKLLEGEQYAISAYMDRPGTNGSGAVINGAPLTVNITVYVNGTKTAVCYPGVSGSTAGTTGCLYYTATASKSDAYWPGDNPLYNESILLYRYAPELGSQNTSFNILTKLNISYGTFQQVRTSTSKTLTVARIYLSNCSSGYGKAWAARVKTYNETSYAQLSPVQYYVEVTARGTNTSVLKNFSWEIYRPNFTLCPFPTWANLTIDADFAYEKGTKPLRTYAVRTFPINTTTKTTFLTYLLDANQGADISVYLFNEYNAPLSEYVLKAQKKRYDTNTWIDVLSVETDDNGFAPAFLTLQSVAYRWLAYKDNVLLKTFPPQYIPDTALDPEELRLLLPSESEEIYPFVNGMQVDCLNSNDSLVVCDVTDPTGAMTNARLEVRHNLLWNSQTVCEEQDSGSAVTLICNLENESTALGNYTYALWVRRNSDSIWYLVMTGYKGAVAASSYGNSGWFITAMVVATLALMGLWNPTVAIMLAYLGLVYMELMGFVSIGLLAIGSLGVILMVVIVLLREK